MTAAPNGTAAAQDSPSDLACKTQLDRENELKAMNLSFSHFLLEEARIAVRTCRVRFAETEQDRLGRERSQAGNAYANAAPFSQERRDAARAWKEANEAVKNHETANPTLAGQPYNDGLSDFERHYCIQQKDFGTTQNPTNPSNHVRDVETHATDPERTYTLNMITATCWH